MDEWLVRGHNARLGVKVFGHGGRALDLANRNHFDMVLGLGIEAHPVNEHLDLLGWVNAGRNAPNNL